MKPDIEVKLKDTKGVFRHGKKLRIEFKLPGERYLKKRTLDMPVTINNIEFAHMKLQAIKMDIQSGLYSTDPDAFWKKHFPLEYTPPKASLSTVGEFIDAYAEVREDELSYSSCEKIRTGRNKMLEYGFLHRDVSSITTRCIELLRKNMLRSLAPATVSEYLMVLRRSLDEAVKMGNIAYNPFQNISRMTTERDPTETDDVDPFTQEELERLINSVHLPQAKRMIIFLAWSGMRPGEMKALAWEEVDLVQGIAHVKYNINRRGQLKPPKTSAGIRKIELMPFALEILREQQAHTFMLEPVTETLHLKHKRTKQVTRRRVFLSRDNKPYIRPELTTAPKQWENWLRRAKLTHREPYQLRHFFASQMLMAGADPAWLTKQLGHKDWGMIRKVYAKWIQGERPDHRLELAEKLGQVTPRIPQRVSRKN